MDKWECGTIGILAAESWRQSWDLLGKRTVGMLSRHPAMGACIRARLGEAG